MSIEEISAEDAAREIEAGGFLLDVRNDDEWEAGRAPGAEYITLQQLPERYSEISTDATIIVVCRAGGRSLKASEFLATQGIVAKNLSGGMQAWAAAGLAVIDSQGATGTVI